MVRVKISADRAPCVSKWILLLGVTALLFACAPARPVYIPPQWQTPPPRTAPAEAVKPEAQPPKLEQPIVTPPPQIKEQDLSESAAAASATSTGPASSTPSRAAEPQYLASMHLVDQAKASLAAGDADNAIPPLEQAIQVDVYNGQAFFELARAWKMKDSPEKALEFANKAEILLQDNRSELKRVYQFKAEIYRELDDPAKAEYFLQQASRL